MKKAVIFDLDGTLVHTSPEYRYARVGRALSRLGLPPGEKHHIDSFWFEMDRASIIQNHFGAKPDIFWQAFKEVDDIAHRKLGMYAYDDVDVLENLKSMEMKMGIVTGAPTSIISHSLSLLPPVFDSVVLCGVAGAPERFARHKPHPDGIFKCLEEIGITAGKSIFVGNSEEDAHAAVNAGMDYVIVNRDEYKFGFNGLNPRIIQSLHDLHSLL